MDTRISNGLYLFEDSKLANLKTGTKQERRTQRDYSSLGMTPEGTCPLKNLRSEISDKSFLMKARREEKHQDSNSVI